MIESFRQWVSRVLRVPDAPTPPAGDPGSFLSFRAGEKYLLYKRLLWGIGQLAALAGILGGLIIPTLIGWNPGDDGIAGIGFRWDWWAAGGILTATLFVPQAVFSYAALRLDYDLRWYILSDRALRIRQGVFVVQEQTLTFANIQSIEVKRNIIQRLLGLADVEVRTAGGGDGDSGPGKTKGYESHRGVLRGVADGPRIRDTIQERVRRYRSAGLGDPDDDAQTAGESVGHSDHGSPRDPAAADSRAVSAARDLLQEVRLLRRDLGGDCA